MIRKPLLVALILIILLLGAGEALSPGFASMQQILRLLIVAALLGVVAAGQNLVILGGREGIDLSVGGVVSLAAILAGNVMDGNNANIIAAIAVCLAAGGLVGLFNGVGITIFGIPPLVMTLGMLGVLQGLLVVIRQGIPSGLAAPALANFVSKPFLLGLPGVIWLWIGVGLLMAFLLRRTTLGYRIYAIGSNENAAFMAGTPVKTVRIMLFVLSSMFSALAGLCILGYAGTSFANVGDSYMLSSIIAVVLGGTPLSGGKGGYTGTMAGAFLLVLMQSILTTLSIGEAGRQIIYGITLLVLLLFYGRSKALRG
ncbi:ABC transporter permease [uncultured Cohaesibacter sp.]|uniref:ABC transporter permease n=1 Tax=uncultured Cohaesibacter sp. TaxID=1002546 RepID=UPI003747ACC3